MKNKLKINNKISFCLINLLLAFILLHGCSANNRDSEQDDLEDRRYNPIEYKNWYVDADIAININNKGKNESFSGVIYLEESVEKTKIAIYTSLGITLLKAVENRNKNTTEILIKNEPKKKYRTIEEALSNKKYLDLPIANIKNWLRGLVDNNDEVKQFSKYGLPLLTTTKHNGKTWQAESSWGQENNFSHPKKLVIAEKNIIINISDIEWRPIND